MGATLKLARYKYQRLENWGARRAAFRSYCTTLLAGLSLRFNHFSDRTLRLTRLYPRTLCGGLWKPGVASGECAVDEHRQLFGFIILHLGVNAHRYFTVFVPCQILNCFWINGGMDQIGDVGMHELVGGDMEIQAVDDFAVVCGFFTQNRVHGMDDLSPFSYRV